MRMLLVALVLLVAAAAAGCGDDEEAPMSAPTATDSATGPTGPAGQGGGDGEEGDGVAAGEPAGGNQGSPREQVAAAIEAFFVSGDPQLVCERLATERLVRSAYGDREGCARAQQPGAIPRAVEIGGLQIEGDTAEAVVVPRGGPNDGIETEVSLVGGADGWKLDALEADIPPGP